MHIKASPLKISAICLLLTTALLATQPAWAKDDDHWDDEHHGEEHGRPVEHAVERPAARPADRHVNENEAYEHGRRPVVIQEENRNRILDYQRTQVHIPPGQLKKRYVRHYVIGERLPPTIVYRPVPQPLLVQLEPAPVGYEYVQTDNDVLLIDQATRDVVDAVSLLSAVGTR